MSLKTIQNLKNIPYTRYKQFENNDYRLPRKRTTMKRSIDLKKETNNISTNFTNQLLIIYIHHLINNKYFNKIERTTILK